MLVQADKELFLLLNSLHSNVLDFLMWHISGKFIWIPLYALILYAIIRRYKVQGLYFVAGIILTIVAADQISVLIKNGVERLRPSHNPEFEGLIHIVNNYRGGTYGFVSSHAANSFGLATFVALIFHKQWITVAMLSWALVVSYSRIYLGVHYPADIVCGGMLGSLLAVVLFYATKFLLCRLGKHNSGS
jgi:undecaprenyl-diphosphatase